MGKGAVTRGQPGASAAAEGRRAERTARRRGLATTGLAFLAAILTAAGWATGHWALIGCGLGAAAWAWRWRPAPDQDRWRRGSEGEAATAVLLARLPRRFVVLHDRRMPGQRGNIDHLVVGPSGVWVVDSKVRRARLRVHRGRVWAGDHAIDVAPVTAQAARAEEALGVPVAAVVAVHGNGLRRRGKKVDGVLVVPAHRLVRRLRRGRRLPRTPARALATQAERLFPSRLAEYWTPGDLIFSGPSRSRPQGGPSGGHRGHDEV
jgi:hypothetical protein